jgi:hypothetical protein
MGYEKLKSEQEQKKGSTTGFRSHSSTGFRDSVKQEKEILLKETIVIKPTKGCYYDFKLSKEEHLKMEISSNNPIDIYFVDDANFDKWDKGKQFEYKDGTEGILETTIDYIVTRTGIWYLLIENKGRKSATVSVSQVRYSFEFS